MHFYQSGREQKPDNIGVIAYNVEEGKPNTLLSEYNAASEDSVVKRMRNAFEKRWDLAQHGDDWNYLINGIAAAEIQAATEAEVKTNHEKNRAIIDSNTGIAM